MKNELIRNLFKAIIVIHLTLVLSESMRSQGIQDSTTHISDHYIYFDSDEFILDKADMATLSYVMLMSEKHPLFRIKIEAHTDSDGSNDYNIALSQKRTESARDFLVQNGIDASNISTSFHGESDPISKNSTQEGKKKNRRAKISLYKLSEVFHLVGVVADQKSKERIPYAKIFLETKKNKDNSLSNDEGFFQFKMPLDIVFKLNVSAPEYIFEPIMLKSDVRTLSDTVFLYGKKIEPGLTIDLTKLYFVGNKAILLPRSAPELEKLLSTVSVNKDICFEIVGHVNYPNRPKVDSSSHEFQLSAARSKVIYDLLVCNGIFSSRMYYSARGNWDMVYPDASESWEMQANRRVEIKIKECEEVMYSKNVRLKDGNFDFFGMDLSDFKN